MAELDFPLAGKSPSDIAMELVQTPRYAIFTDTRGVVFCEKVDHNIVVMATLGKTMGHQPTLYRNVLKWEGDKHRFNDEGRSLFERGFTIEQDMAYMVENHWGVAKVLKTVTDLAAGKKLCRILRKGTPEGFYDDTPDLFPTAQERKVHNKYHRPVQPFTKMVLDCLAGVSRSRATYADMFDRTELGPGEQMWLDRWVVSG